MKKIIVMGVAISCLFFVACDFKGKNAGDLSFFNNDVSAADDWVDFTVLFRAQGASPDLEVISGPQKCNNPNGHPRLGCLGFTPDSFGTITLRLQGTNNNQCGEGGVSWVITKVEATVKEESGTDGEKGDYTQPVNPADPMLPAWVQASIWPIQDADTGVLYSVDRADIYDDARTSVRFVNMNRSPAASGIKVLWYRVTATECPASAQDTSDLDSKVSDPRIENEGVN